MVSILAMICGAVLAFVAWARWDDTPKYAVVAALSVGLFAVGMFATPQRPGGDGSYCYTDWDGRSNSTVCD